MKIVQVKKTCGVCRGTKKAISKSSDKYGNGKGKNVKVPCFNCDGKGYFVVTEYIE